MTDAWEVLLSGKLEKAIRQFKAEYERDPDDIGLVNLGFANLYANRVDDAEGIFDELIAAKPRKMDMYYAGQGIVRWVRDDPLAAVKIWDEGTHCVYGDPAGGFTTLLLMYFAAMRHPEVCDKNKVIERIHTLSIKPRSVHWPGPIGKFILGEMSTEALTTLAQAEPAPQVKSALAQMEFYVGIRAFNHGDLQECSSRFTFCATARIDFFLSEQILARYELQHLKLGTTDDGNPKRKLSQQIKEGKKRCQGRKGGKKRCQEP